MICIEIGGPEPGIGCAGHGIILGIEILQKVGVFEYYRSDIVIFDVPGDIVCGGLAMPLRRGFADQVYVVTSSEYLPLHAANNLLKAIRRFATRGGSRLGGLIYNARGHIDIPDIVEEFARRVNTSVVYRIPKLPEVVEAESQAKTVIELSPNSRAAQIFRELANTILSNDRKDIPRPLEISELQKLYVKYVGQIC